MCPCAEATADVRDDAQSIAYLRYTRLTDREEDVSPVRDYHNSEKCIS
jgi:hypothetical protein